MKRINRFSDFTLTIALKDSSGDPIAPPSNPWEIHIADTAGTCWRCSFDGTHYEDCQVVNNQIVCFVDNPGYVSGEAIVTFHNNVPDANFGDGYYNQVVPLTDEIVFFDGPTDTNGEIETSLILEYFDAVAGDYVTSDELTAAVQGVTADVAETYATKTEVTTGLAGKEEKSVIVQFISPGTSYTGITRNATQILAEIDAGKMVYLDYQGTLLPATKYSDTMVIFEGMHSIWMGSYLRNFVRYRISTSDGNAGVLDTQVVSDFSYYLTSNEAASTYLTIADAQSTYMTEGEVNAKCITALHMTIGLLDSWRYFEGVVDSEAVIGGQTVTNEITLTQFVDKCEDALLGHVDYKCVVQESVLRIEGSTPVPVYTNIIPLVCYPDPLQTTAGLKFCGVAYPIRNTAAPATSCSLLSYTLGDDGLGNWEWTRYEYDIDTLLADKASVASVTAKADKVAVTNVVPQGGMLPNVDYNLGTTDTVNITLAAPTDNTVENIYTFTFTAQSASCSVSLPNNVLLANEYQWDMVADRYYEVAIKNNVASILWADPTTNNS